MIEPDFEPLLVGLKTTAMVHVLLAESCVELVHVPPVAEAKLPLMEMLESLSVVVPVFLTVIVFDALVVPDFCVPKLMLVGLRVTSGLMTAVTLIGIVCGLLEPLSVITRFAP